MSDRATAETSKQLNLAAVVLLTFSSAALPSDLFASVRDGQVLVVALSQAVLLAGILIAAVSSREQMGRLGRQGAISGLLFAFLISSQALLWHLVNPGIAPAEIALVGSVVGNILAGIALAALLQAQKLRCGHFTSAYLMGLVAAPLLTTQFGHTPTMMVFLIGGSAAAGALLMAQGRTGVVIQSAAAFIFILSAAPLALQGTGWQITTLTIHGPDWRLPQTILPSLRVGMIVGCAFLAVTMPGIFISSYSKEVRTGLARLHTMSILWPLAACLLLWPMSQGLKGDWGALSSGTVLSWLVIGGLIAGLALDTWSVLRGGLTKASIGGAAGAAICLAIVFGLVEKTEPAIILPLALAVCGLFLGLPLPTVVRVGVLVDSVHAIWLWASGLLASIALVCYLQGLDYSGQRMSFPGIGIILTIIFLTVASELSGLRSAPAAALKWLQQEWKPLDLRPSRIDGVQAPSYPYTLRQLQLISYLGYFPWWVAGSLLRLIWSVIQALFITISSIATGLFGSLLELVFGKSLMTTAQKVLLEEKTPIVSLVPSEEAKTRLVPETKEEKPPHGLSNLLTAPILILAAGLTRLIVWRQKRQAKKKLPAVKAPEEVDTVETIIVAAPPKVAPGYALTALEVRENALRRRTVESKWHRWLRIATANLARLTPDKAESWDDRFYRVEAIGPRGKTFELAGHLWRSPRRCGCVVTIPISSGRIDKTVEVDCRHGDLRKLLTEESEQVKRMLLRAAFRIAVMDINSGLVKNRTLECQSPRQELIEPHQDRQCELREEIPGRGHRCKQPLEQDRTRGGTNLSSCANCNFPEIWERCNHLRLDGTTGFEDEEGELQRRAHVVCRLTEQPVQPEECLQKDCFSPSVITRIIALDYIRTH